MSAITTVDGDNRTNLLDSAFELAVTVLHARRASLLLKSEQARDELFIAKAKGLQEQVVRESRIRIGTQIAGRVALDRRPLLVSDVDAQPEFPHPRRTVYSTPSFASAPILIRGEAFGVVNVADKMDNTPFSESDLFLLIRFAEHLAACLVFEQQLSQATEQARLDPLTGLLNRRVLDEILPQEIERAKRSGRTGCLLMLDVDKFKHINDTYGHPAGDFALRTIARSIREHLRKYDSVFRYGGDEFTVLLPATRQEQADVVVRRISHAIEKADVSNAALPENGLHVSIGTACFPVDGQNVAEVIGKADSALYAARARLVEPNETESKK